MYRISSPVNPINLCPNVNFGLMEGSRRVQMILFKREEIKHAGYVGQDILSYSLVEGPGFVASQSIVRVSMSFSSDLVAWILSQSARNDGG